MLGIGVDVVNLNQMADTLQRSGEIFLTRVFSPAEIERGLCCENKLHFFASTFAAKEATFKALTLTWQPEIDLRNIEINRGPFGEPLISLSGRIAEIAKSRGEFEISVSISYETTIAIAMVVIQFHKSKIPIN